MNICPRCRSSRLSNAGKVASVPWKICRNCDFAGEAQEFRPETVFDHITSSPKVLAAKFVYFATSDEYGRDYWKSSLLDGRFWKTYKEAIAATIKELKRTLK